MSLSKTNRIPAVALIGAMMLWGSSFIALKLAFAVYDPMVVIFARMLIATCCFAFVMKRIWRFEYRRGDMRYLLLMAAGEPCLYFLFEAAALQNTSASQAGMITSLLPLLVSLGAFVAFRERIHRNMLLGFALAIAGAFLLSLASVAEEGAPNPMLGNFQEFMAMVCAMVYTLCLKHLSARYSPWMLTAVQTMIGSLFFFPFLFLPQTVLPSEFNAQGVGAIVFLGTLINIGAYGLFNYGVSRIPASHAAGFVNLIPVFTLVFAFALLGESLSPLQLFCSGLVLLGVWVGQREPQAPPLRARTADLTGTG